MKIYLAHAFEDRHNIRGWQNNISLPNIELVNPFYDLEEDDIKTIDKKGITRQQIDSGEFLLDPELIVPKDIEGITECDCLMAYFTDKKSIGMPMEIVYAYTLGLEIHSVCLSSEYHPWVQYHSDRIFPFLADYTLYLRNKSEEDITPKASTSSSY